MKKVQIWNAIRTRLSDILLGRSLCGANFGWTAYPSYRRRRAPAAQPSSCGNIGSDTISGATFSATGKSPAPYPNHAYAFCRCSGTG